MKVRFLVGVCIGIALVFSSSFASARYKPLPWLKTLRVFQFFHCEDTDSKTELANWDTDPQIQTAGHVNWIEYDFAKKSFVDKTGYDSCKIKGSAQSPGMLIEFHCKGLWGESTVAFCPVGTKCTNNACVPDPKPDPIPPPTELPSAKPTGTIGALDISTDGHFLAFLAGGKLYRHDRLTAFTKEIGADCTDTSCFLQRFVSKDGVVPYTKYIKNTAGEITSFQVWLDSPTVAATTAFDIPVWPNIDLFYGKPPISQTVVGISPAGKYLALYDYTYKGGGDVPVPGVGWRVKNIASYLATGAVPAASYVVLNGTNEYHTGGVTDDDVLMMGRVMQQIKDDSPSIRAFTLLPDGSNTKQLTSAKVGFDTSQLDGMYSLLWQTTTTQKHYLYRGMEDKGGAWAYPLRMRHTLADGTWVEESPPKEFVLASATEVTDISTQMLDQTPGHFRNEAAMSDDGCFVTRASSTELYVDHLCGTKETKLVGSIPAMPGTFECIKRHRLSGDGQYILLPNCGATLTLATDVGPTETPIAGLDLLLLKNPLWK